MCLWPLSRGQITAKEINVACMKVKKGPQQCVTVEGMAQGWINKHVSIFTLQNVGGYALTAAG